MKKSVQNFAKVCKTSQGSFPVLLILIFLLVSFSLSANFITMNWGAKAYSLGNAFVAMADDPTAVFCNPAGISRIDRFSLTVSHQNLYGIPDLYNEMAVAVFPFSYVNVGLGWTQVNLWEEYHEQIIYLSGSKELKLKKMPIYFGLNLKYFSAKANDYDNMNSPDNFDVDVGILIEPLNELSLGCVGRNLTQPSFEFFNTADKIHREIAAGVHYSWRRILNFLIDYVWNSEQGQINLGTELWFFNVFAPRIGLNEEYLTTGFGIKARDWTLDGAVLSHKELGSTYRLSFGIQFKVVSKK